MKRIIETAVFFIGTLGWWGFVYPELCLTQDTYEIVEDADEAGICEEAGGSMEESGETAYLKRTENYVTQQEREIPDQYCDMEDYLNLKGKVCIKSRLIEYLYQEKEK